MLSRRVPTLLITGLIISAWCAWLVSALLGVHFGRHWDESIQYALSYNSITSGLFLPRRQSGVSFYNYPGLTYWLTLAVNVWLNRHLIFDSIPVLPTGPLVSFEAFCPIARCLFIFISSVGGIFLFLSLRRISVFAAIVAGCLYFGSFEVLYHSRWIAPDMLLTSLTCLWIYCQSRANERRADFTRWIVYGGAVAGIAAATKYQGCILLALSALHCMVYQLSHVPHTIRSAHQNYLRFFLSSCRQLGVLAKRLSITSAVFLGAFVLITPGAALEPYSFFRDVQSEINHYNKGHWPYLGAAVFDIPSYSNYFTSQLEYYFFSLSGQPVLSAIFFLLAMSGLIWGATRADLRPLVITLFTGVVAYMVYMSTKRVFVVRNFLFIIPMVMALCGIGCFGVMKITARPFRTVFITAISVLVGYSLCSNAATALSFTKFDKNENLFRSARAYVEASPHEIAVSCFIAQQTGLPATIGDDSYRYVMFYLREMEEAMGTSLVGLKNDRYNSVKMIGKQDVNMNYYFSWLNTDKVLIMARQKAYEYNIINALKKNC